MGTHKQWLGWGLFVLALVVIFGAGVKGARERSHVNHGQQFVLESAEFILSGRMRYPSPDPMIVAGMSSEEFTKQHMSRQLRKAWPAKRFDSERATLARALGAFTYVQVVTADWKPKNRQESEGLCQEMSAKLEGQYSGGAVPIFIAVRSYDGKPWRIHQLELGKPAKRSALGSGGMPSP